MSASDAAQTGGPAPTAPTSTGDPASSGAPVPAGGPPAEVALAQPFNAGGLIALRSAVAAHAADLGLSSPRRDDLILLAHELASNAVVHGGGEGMLRLWIDDGHVYCEVSDSGPGLPTGDTLSHEQPPLGATGGRGLWLVRVLADAIDVRSGPDGTTITTAVRSH